MDPTTAIELRPNDANELPAAPKQRGLPLALRQELVEKASEGTTQSDLARWLAEVHGITITRQAVAKYLQAVHTERVETTKAIVREKLSRTAPADVDRLELLIDQAFCKLQGVDNDTRAWIKLADLARRLLDTKLHYSGADTPDDRLVEIAEAGERLTRRISGIAVRLGAEAGAEGAGTDPE